MIDITTPGSPGWMLDRVSKKLASRADRYSKLADRYEGRPPKSTVGWSPAFAAFWEKAHTNFAELIVRALRYRMSVHAVRTLATEGELEDARAWVMFKQLQLDVALPDTIRTMLTMGDGYMIVGHHNGRLIATAEDPRQVATIHDPVQQSVVLYAGKLFHHAEDLRDYAYLYTPDRVYVAYRERRSAGVVRFSRGWDWDESRGGADGLPHPSGRTPVFRFRNDEGVGEFERHTGLLDRIDHMTLQGMVIATMQAFKQRAIKAPPEAMPDYDEETGEPIDWDEVLTAAPDRIWRLPETAEIWESGGVDLTPIFTGNDKNIQQLSAVTFTPLSMFSPEGQNQTAEGASLAREGLTTKATDRIQRVGATLAEVLATCFRMAGDDDRDDPASIIIDWLPVERYGLSEKYNALVQAKAGGVPWRTRMADIAQFNPRQIQRMEQERMDDLMMGELDAAGPTAD